MRNIYLRASFKDIRPMPKSLVPALEIGVEFSISKSTPGEMLQIPDGAQGIMLDHVQGFLFWNTPGDTDWLRGYIATGLPAPVWYSQILRDEQPAQDCTLVFPLSHSMISTMESLRSGRDADMRVLVRASGYASVLIKQFNPPEVQKGDMPMMQKAFAQAVQTDFLGSAFHVNRLVLSDRYGTNQSIVVAKSRWAEDILPGLGWGVSKLIELPLAGVEDAMKDTDRLLDEAQRKFFDGDWTGSLTASRKAVETLQPVMKSHINPAHTDEDKGKTAEQKADDLTERFQTLATAALGYHGAVLKMLHAGAHKPVPGGTLERPDAELGLLLALGIRRYVGVRMSSPK